MRRRTVVLIALAAALIVAGSVVAVRLLDDVAATLPEELPAAEWSGPVRLDPGPMVVHQMAAEEDGTLAWAERRDTSLAWVDITHIGFNTINDGSWQIQLAAQPPPAAGLRRDELIAYGLVLETTGDGTADFVVGIDNDAPQPGDFHVWVTNLATNQTDQQIGPPYGFPVEFSHPDERTPGDPPGPAAMAFTFLLGTAPWEDLNRESVLFYAWSSATTAGRVAAWDYAPDTSWLTARLDPR